MFYLQGGNSSAYSPSPNVGNINYSLNLNSGEQG